MKTRLFSAALLLFAALPLASNAATLDMRTVVGSYLADQITNSNGSLVVAGGGYTNPYTGPLPDYSGPFPYTGLLPDPNNAASFPLPWNYTVGASTSHFATDASLGLGGTSTSIYTGATLAVSWDGTIEGAGVGITRSDMMVGFTLTEAAEVQMIARWNAPTIQSPYIRVGSGTLNAVLRGCNSNFTLCGNFSGNTISSGGLDLGNQMISMLLQPGNYAVTSSFGYDLGQGIATVHPFPEYQIAASASYAVTLSVAPVPIPASAWLFGSGLAGLIGFARRSAWPA